MTKQRVAVRPTGTAIQPARMHLGVVVAGRDSTSETPYRYQVAPIEEPYGNYVVGAVSSRSLTVTPALEDGQWVSLLWDTDYPAAPEGVEPVTVPFAVRYGRANMQYSAASGLIEDVAGVTEGDLWYGEGGFVPEGGKVRVFAHPALQNVLLRTIVPREFLISVPVIAVIQKTSVAIPVLIDASNWGHKVETYASFAWHTDMYWEWLAFEDIWPA